VVAGALASPKEVTGEYGNDAFETPGLSVVTRREDMMNRNGFSSSLFEC
jgi:hypothetical protein